jgi:hypothetical protein
LQRLPNADFAQKFQYGAFGRRNRRRAIAIFEGADVQQLIGLFIEQPLAVVLAGKLSEKPSW